MADKKISDLTHATPALADKFEIETAAGNSRHSTGQDIVNMLRDLGAIHAYEEQASGKAGGGSIASTWITRAYNTVGLNTISGASLKSSTVTITIASPGLVTWNSHGLATGEAVMFTTTGALPTGLTAGTVYYVVSPTTNSFSVAATPGGAAINTSGTQSGTHTACSGLISLPAGDYEVFGTAPAFGSQANAIRLYDATNSAVLLKGETVWSSATTIERRLGIRGRFTLVGTALVRLEQYSSSAVATNGLGVDSGFSGGVNNHFTDLYIRRIA